MLKNIKNFKQLLLGIIIGGTIFGAIGVGATEYIIKQNTYPILVNGTAQAVDALNINDFTYIKLRDVSKALNNLASVKFNELNETVEIDTVASSVYNTTPIVTPTPSVNVNTVPIVVPSTTPNIIPSTNNTVDQNNRTYMQNNYTFIVKDGIEYYPLRYISELYYGKGYSFIYNNDLKTYSLQFNNDPNGNTTKTQTLLDKLETITFEDRGYVTKTYYEQILLPLLSK